MADNRERLIAKHLMILARNEAKAKTRFKKLLASTYRGAARAYESAGRDGIDSYLYSLREGVFHALAATYKDIIPEYARYITKQLREMKGYTPSIQLKGYEDDEEDFITLNTRWILQEGLKRTDLITATTKKDVLSVIERGVLEGDGISEIAKGIKELAGEYSRARARLIAITEVHNAASFASIESAKATGLTLVKEWAATEDHRTRPTHSAANGQTVDMNDLFTVGGYRMDRPGDPSAPAEEVINCRCGLLYHEKTFNFSDE